MNVLFISSDLFSASQFANSVRQAGHEVRTALTVPASFDAVAESVIVIDLETADAVDAIRSALVSGKRSVAFGPHVKVALLEEAKSAGCHAVLTRGQAIRDLGAIVGRLAAS